MLCLEVCTIVIVTDVFILQDACDINSVTNSGETALHLAVQQGHYRIVERLVGFGASLNIVDHDGNTCLHHALASQVPGSISADAPQIQKVYGFCYYSVTLVCYPLL